MIIPYTAGGVAETVMRLLAVSMEPRLGQKLVIEAKPGAAGNIGTQEVARAEPDGYTILVAATNNFVINQFLMKMTFDPLAALAPIAKLADVPLVLFSNPAGPGAHADRVHRLARANPGKIELRHPEPRHRQSPADRAVEAGHRRRHHPGAVSRLAARRRWRCSRTTSSCSRSGLPRSAAISAKAR